LELLALGAPAELVEKAHVAALDEIEHARICFALASAYGGERYGPGPLDAVTGGFASGVELEPHGRLANSTRRTLALRHIDEVLIPAKAKLLAA
jgi:hypothetical protein